MLKDNREEKDGTHVGNMMIQRLQGFSDNQPIRHPFENHVSETQPTDNAFNQIEAHKALPPMEASRTDAEKPIIGSNMQELISFLSANYGPMKTPLEIGTPEYLRLVEILQQSGGLNDNDNNNNNNNTPSEQNEIISRNDKEKIQKTDSKKLHCEKLWEGSLQLSSTVTLSANAFFKSGEKLVGNNWPESIEVKGKVRLEAFEKYVKDLPRSRNRGLMVTSVRWKEGSSNTGLTGMKEVAKGYKKSSRVGFAQLLSGIDLYICPRSDQIITILAKYGFFKGMSVLDDKQDSMIGCVVWRKNRPLNSIKNTPDNPNSLPIKQVDQSLTLPLTSITETNKTIPLVSATDVDHNGVESTSNSSSDTCNLVQKRGFQDVDDLPEFDFGARLVNREKTYNSRLSKKTKIFDDDMPEWCPPAVHRQVPPQHTTTNFQKLPLCPPRPPPVSIPPPPRPDTRPLFSYQPFRPAVPAPPPTFMRPPPPPPPPPPPSQQQPPPPPPQLPLPPPPQWFNPNQAMWHRPGSFNGNPLFVSPSRRHP